MVKINNPVKKSKPNSRKRKILGAAIAVIFIVICLVGYARQEAWNSWVGDPSEILAVADKFKPDPSWELTGAGVKPPANNCSFDGASYGAICPTVDRYWALPEKLTKEQFLDIGKAQEGQMNLQLNDYLPCFSGHTNYDMCNLKDVVGEYTIELDYNSNTENYKDKGYKAGDVRYSYGPVIHLYVHK